MVNIISKILNLISAFVLFMSIALCIIFLRNTNSLMYCLLGFVGIGLSVLILAISYAIYEER